TPQIEIKNLDKHYGAFHALKDVCVTIPRGAFVALVGPSGCGKSTLLRCLAGLERISGGEITIAGERVNQMPPRKRDVAMVFQSYALYPHMTVLGNLTYSMRFKRIAKAEARRKADEVASTIGLEKLLDRYPRELSGGQRQRVAMGRAIVREPKAFLFDEPLSNLDAALRVHMRSEVRSLHDRLGATSVYVTHDQIEAMTMADHVVVMRAGVVEQQGSPLELYDRPVNRFVAGFIGSPAMNFVTGTVTEDGRGVTLDLPGAPVLGLDRALPPGRRVEAGMRPEHLKIDAANPLTQVEIGMVESTGTLSYYTTRTEPALMLLEQGRSRLRAGETAPIGIAPGDVHLFDAETGEAL
ncbi:ABC transporter ATP-binding protein, partial [Pseudoroseicyclus aestuarii]